MLAIEISKKMLTKVVSPYVYWMEDVGDGGATGVWDRSLGKAMEREGQRREECLDR